MSFQICTEIQISQPVECFFVLRPQSLDHLGLLQTVHMAYLWLLCSEVVHTCQKALPFATVVRRGKGQCGASTNESIFFFPQSLQYNTDILPSTPK